MAKFYGLKILNGELRIENVPKLWRADVRKWLEENRRAIDNVLERLKYMRLYQEGGSCTFSRGQTGCHHSGCRVFNWQN